MNILKKKLKRWHHHRAGNDSEITLFDVKQLYDEAYEEKAKARVCLKRFRRLIAQAQRLDALYRTQLETAAVARHRRVA